MLPYVVSAHVGKLRQIWLKRFDKRHVSVRILYFLTSCGVIRNILTQWATNRVTYWSSF